MELKWKLPEETKLDRLQDQVQTIPEKPDGMSEAQMQEALQTKVLWMLSCFYRNDTAGLNEAARSVYQWLREAGSRGYQGDVWDYLNLELLKLDARMYRKREQWDEVQKDLEACEPIVSRLEGSLQSDAISAEDRLCLAVSCAETEILRYFQKKQTGSVLEGYQAFGSVRRFFEFELPENSIRSDELRTLAGLQLLMSATKLNPLNEKEKAALAAKQGNDILNDTQAYFGGAEPNLSAVLALYSKALFTFNYAEHSAEEWDRFITEYQSDLSVQKQKLETFGDVEENDRLAWAMLRYSYALMINFGVLGAVQAPSPDYRQQLSYESMFAGMMPDILNTLKTAAFRRRRGWDLILDAVYELAYLFEITMISTKALCNKGLQDFPAAQNEIDSAMKKLNRGDLASDTLQQLLLQLTFQYISSLIELEKGNDARAYYIADQALNMYNNSDLGFRPPGIEGALLMFYVLAGLAALSKKEKAQAREYAESGLALIEDVSRDKYLSDGQDFSIEKKELNRILRKSKGFFF